MKKRLALVLAALTLVGAACAGDDDDTENMYKVNNGTDDWYTVEDPLTGRQFRCSHWVDIWCYELNADELQNGIVYP